MRSGLLCRNCRSWGTVAAGTRLAQFASQAAVEGEGMPLAVGGVCLLAVPCRAGTGLCVLEGGGDPSAPIPSLVRPMGQSLSVW